MISFGPAFAQSVPAEIFVSALIDKKRMEMSVARLTKYAQSKTVPPDYGRTRNDSTSGHTAAVRYILNWSFAEAR
jgi:hypothetical protein